MRRLICMLLSLLLLTSCSNEKVNTSTEAITKFIGNKYISETGKVINPLDTTVKFVAYHETYVDEAFEILKAQIENYHKLVDSSNTYLDESGNRIVNIKVINESYGTEEPITVDPVLIEVINEAKKMMKLSKGYFNMTLGSVISLYDGKFMNIDTINTDPPKEDLEEAMGCVVSVEEIDKIIEVDENNSTVTLHKKDSCNGKVEIQLGAYTKGYIASKIDEMLKSLNISYMIDLGASSILTHYGEKDTKNTWNVAIRSIYPEIPYQYVVLMDGSYSLSTSGDDQKYYFTETAEGTTVRRHHILNPSTGYSENHYRGVSVIAKNGNAGVLDVLSTVLYNVESIKERVEIVNAFEEAYDIEIGYGLVEESDDNRVILIMNEVMAKQAHKDYIGENVKEILIEE